jgi:hypothetical protein
MTDSAPGDLASLEPLEPLDGGATGVAQGAGNPDAALQQLRSVLPAPGFNPYCRDKSFYRFLWAGVILFVGCMMPIGPDLNRAAYQTMSGGIYLLIAIGLVWSWWASIANNRPVGVKWVMLATLPLIGGIMNLVGFDAAAAHKQAVDLGLWSEASGFKYSASWGAMFGDMGSALMKDAEAGVRVEGFWRLLGVGHVFQFLGGLIAELGFLGGIVGGAKQNKADMKAKMMASAERKRR